MSSKALNPAVSVSSVGIRFLLKQKRSPAAAHLRGWLNAPRREEFWALRDISFEAHRGEILGIIGGNGAGKSTLLKIIAGIFPATEGSVETRGQIAPLIELGAAFVPELTGLENIYLTGSIYRIPRKTIRRHLDRIIDFAGIRKFINSPVKNYSSGMFIRLAFSIVIFFQPDIALIDEVFSVGDQVFQQRSFEKIMSFKDRGSTIILVSHDLNTIGRICNRVLVLNRGAKTFLGPTEEGIQHYMQLIKTANGAAFEAESAPDGAPENARRWGNRYLQITAVRFTDESGNPKTEFETGEHFEARIDYTCPDPKTRAVFGVSVATVYKLLIYGPNTLEAGLPEKIPGTGTVRFMIPELPLLEGDYLFTAAAYDPSLQTAYDHQEMMYHFRVAGTGGRETGCIRFQSSWSVASD
jgi:ABC-type polysaccharide/polyol phosphate transport system ATPase subunit